MRTLIRRGLSVSARIEELAEKKKEIEAQIMEMVKEDQNRDPHDTVTLRLEPDAASHIEISWRKEYKINVEKAQRLRQKLPAEVFATLFSVTEKFSRARSYGKGLREAGLSTAIKKRVEAAVEEAWSRSPRFSWKALDEE